MEFEFGSDKSSVNRQKHGIDFEDAQELWEDPMLLEAPARTEDEPRFMAIGRIGDRFWSAIYAMRESRCRIISVRRARKEEVQAYES